MPALFASKAKDWVKCTPPLHPPSGPAPPPYEQVDDVAVSVPRGSRQCHAVVGVHVGTGPEEHPHDLRLPCRGRKHQRFAQLRPDLGHVRADLEERGDEACAVAPHRVDKRSLPERRDVGPCFYERYTR